MVKVAPTPTVRSAVIQATEQQVAGLSGAGSSPSEPWKAHQREAFRRR
jgi:hypothetical protein